MKIYLEIAGHPNNSNLQPKLFSSKSIEVQSDTLFIEINLGGGSNPDESVTVRQWSKE